MGSEANPAGRFRTIAPTHRRARPTSEYSATGKGGANGGRFAVLMAAHVTATCGIMEIYRLYCARVGEVGQNSMDNLLQRITFDKEILGGKPTVRGLRISVEMILELLAKGATSQEILEDHPDLEEDDVRAALHYAHHLVAGETVVAWVTQ
jgi:uncharacterized protein (DUF433 family)